MNPSKISSKTILEYLLLALIKAQPDPTKQIADRLEELEFIIPMGTLYPILSELHKQKLLNHGYEEMDKGSPRKTYSITDKGEDRLLTLGREWNNLNRIIRRAEVGC
jgi:PadR family transcriptional regulator PadR